MEQLLWVRILCDLSIMGKHFHCSGGIKEDMSLNVYEYCISEYTMLFYMDRPLITVLWFKVNITNTHLDQTKKSARQIHFLSKMVLVMCLVLSHSMSNEMFSASLVWLYLGVLIMTMNSKQFNAV